MDIFDALILGIVQGLTEFLPISSSGHLVLGQSILNIDQPGNEYEVLVHLGTLLSVIVVFFQDIKQLLLSLNSKKTQTFILFLLIGTLPAVAIGFGFKVHINKLFENVNAVGIALIFTGVILYGSSLIHKHEKDHSLITSILIGFAQAIAIIPGISRSGMTISAALFLGLSSKEAARFSFLLSIPVIIGAGLLTATDLQGELSLTVPVMITGFASSLCIGVLALKWLLNWLEQGKFHYFGFYCMVIGTLTLVL